MLHGFTERFPACVLVWPVRVQGETCAPEVAAAVRGFNALRAGSVVPHPDVLIVARGGGSLEDLWGFNEEIVARAVAESEIPVISAVGHETDWTLIDLVADARAPTPTKAAEWAVPKHSELIARLDELAVRQRQAVSRIVEANRSDLRAAIRGLPRPQDMIGLARQRFDGASGRLGYALRSFATAKRSQLDRWQGRLDIRLISQRAERCHERLASADREVRQVLRRIVQQHHVRLGRSASRLRPGLLHHPAQRGRDRLDRLTARAYQCLIAAAERRRSRLDTLAQLLRSLSHKSVLDRGFALVRDAEGRMVRRVAEAEEAGRLELELADGRIAADVVTGSGDAAPPPARKSPGRTAIAKSETAAPTEKTKQGKLF
jgi:exodeoxyribonuclease VII large subunit